MRVVLVPVTDAELVHRRSAGIDRWDETWEDLRHRTPAPSLEQQRVLELVMKPCVGTG